MRTIGAWIAQKTRRSIERLRGGVSILALAIAFTAAAPAQTTTTWLGNTSSWNAPGNWSNSVPGSATNVVFNAPTPNNPTVSGTGSTHSILFTGTANQSVSGFIILGSSSIENQSNYVASLNGSNIAMQANSVFSANNANGSGITVNATLRGIISSSLTFDTVNSANTITLVRGVITLTTLIKNGAGTLYVQGATTASELDLNGGIYNAVADNGLGYTGGSLLFNGGTLQFSNAFTTSATRGMILNVASAFDTNGHDDTIANIISGAGGLSKIGAGTLTLTQTNSYTGVTTISDGTLALSGTGSIATSGKVQDDGVFDISATTSGAAINSLSGGGQVNLGAQTLTLANAADTFAGSIEGTGGVTLAGGTETLTGANTYTGGTTIAAGTLQLGNGGTSGVISGDITNNGTLAFNRSDAVTFGGVISGSGSISQIGAGTTVLTANNTYSGGTTITAGTLQLGNGGTSGAISGDIANNGALAFNRSDAVTFDGVIFGSGSVSQIGTGTTILTANNPYTGGTTIVAGTLQLGNGGTLGVISGDITNNGTLAFDRSDAVTFGGVISGSGSISQIGAGTTVLTANNTYSGGTTIAAGTLRGSASSFGTGAIRNEATLVIDQPIDAAFANAINGAGSFTKTGSGRLNYIGTGGLTGRATIAAGLLSVNGSLASSAMTVLSSGTLGGNGTVGATTVMQGGTVAPGNSIGTLHINGDFTQAAGSTYQVEVNPNSNASDLISVNGAAELASGAGLNVSKIEPGNYRPGAVYTVLDASGGRSGTYTVTGDTQEVSAFLGLKDTYDANHAYLTVVRTRNPTAAAKTPNQRAVAGNLPAIGAVSNAILNTQTDAATRQAFDQLTGGSHAAAKAVLVADSRLVRDLTIDRVRNLFCASGHPGQQAGEAEWLDGACMPARSRQLVWAQGFGAWGHTGGNGNSSRVGRSTGGVVGGLDMPVAGDWRVGGFLGYSHSNLTQNADAGSVGIDNYHFGLYGGTQRGALGLRFGTAYTTHDIQTDRSVSLPNLSERLRAGYRGHSIQGYAEAGYRIDGERISVEPFANLAYVTLHTNGFAETGGDAALTAGADNSDNTFSTLGVRPSGNLALGAAHATLRGLLGWRHAFGTVTPSSAVQFVQGGGTFNVEGVPIARDAGVLEAGADYRATRNVTLGFTYGTQAANRNLDQSVRANVAVRF